MAAMGKHFRSSIKKSNLAKCVPKNSLPVIVIKDELAARIALKLNQSRFRAILRAEQLALRIINRKQKLGLSELIKVTITISPLDIGNEQCGERSEVASRAIQTEPDIHPSQPVRQCLITLSTIALASNAAHIISGVP
jgi:hypothetical protein